MIEVLEVGIDVILRWSFSVAFQTILILWALWKMMLSAGSRRNFLYFCRPFADRLFKTGLVGPKLLFLVSAPYQDQTKKMIFRYQTTFVKRWFVLGNFISIWSVWIVSIYNSVNDRKKTKINFWSCIRDKNLKCRRVYSFFCFWFKTSRSIYIALFGQILYDSFPLQTR